MERGLMAVSLDVVFCKYLERNEKNNILFHAIQSNTQSTESQQFKTLLENIEEVIALTSKGGIVLTLESRLFADFRQN